MGDVPYLIAGRSTSDRRMIGPFGGWATRSYHHGVAVERRHGEQFAGRTSPEKTACGHFRRMTSGGPASGRTN
jgi:hypothetical protein